MENKSALLAIHDAITVANENVILALMQLDLITEYLMTNKNTSTKGTVYYTLTQSIVETLQATEHTLTEILK